MRDPRTTNRRRGRAGIGLLAVGALVLAACGGDDDDADEPAAEEPATEEPAAEEPAAEEPAAEAPAGDETYTAWALLPQGSDQAYGTQYVPFMENKADELGLELNVVNSGYDGPQQLSDCEIAVAAEPDIIILWPAEGGSIRPCLESINDAGIPVTVTNAGVLPEDEELTRAYSGPDNYGQGAASGELFCEEAGDEETGIIMVTGAPGNSVAIAREEGFLDAIGEQCPNVEVLASQTGEWDKDKSQLAASEMITAVGAENIGGVHASDDSMVAGAIDALKARDIDPTELIVTSIGNTFLGNPLVISGELDGTIFQSSAWDGENAAVTAYEVLTEDPAERIEKLMPSVKVTAENADDPSVAPEW